jgi:hypothetical protein
VTDLSAAQPYSWPRAPRLLSGGLVVYAGDPIPTTPTNVIVFQYNPDTVSRTLQPQGTQPDVHRNAGDTEHMTLPQETITLTIEMEATDQLEASESRAMQYGLHPSLLALELLLHPSSGALRRELDLESKGSATTAPGATPMVLMVWSPNRVVPVRLTSLQVTEEAFDTNLNPIRAKVALSLRSLTVRELKAARAPWSQLVVDQVQQKEQLALKDLQSRPAASLRSIANRAGGVG